MFEFGGGGEGVDFDQLWWLWRWDCGGDGGGCWVWFWFDHCCGEFSIERYIVENLKSKQKLDQKIYAEHKMGWVEKMSSGFEK